MLKPNPFAKSIALTTSVIYVVFYILLLIAPRAFEYIFNAQVFGADIASSVIGSLSFGAFIGVLVTVAITAWIMGYIWATLYNKFAK